MSIGFEELGVGRKERPARARGGESWAGGVEKDSSSKDSDNWYECHEPSAAIILISNRDVLSKRIDDILRTVKHPDGLQDTLHIC